MKQVLLSIFAALVVVNLTCATQSRASPAQGLDSTCMKELETATKQCESSFMDKSHFKHLSPECMRQIESHHFPEPDTACSKEMIEAGQATLSATRECIDKRISLRCREQIDSRIRISQEVSKRCAETTKKISEICGIGQATNMECYKNHRAELETACSAQ